VATPSVAPQTLQVLGFTQVASDQLCVWGGSVIVGSVGSLPVVSPLQAANENNIQNVNSSSSNLFIMFLLLDSQISPFGKRYIFYTTLRNICQYFAFLSSGLQK
jgi:hypothetical protein